MSDKRTTCRISGETLTPLFSLGDIYVSDFLAPGEKPDESSKVELELALAPKSGLVQLTKTADFDAMYKRYWYNSGTNESMIVELRDIVNTITKTMTLKPGDKWIDIGCNDGTLMNEVSADLDVIGVDPAHNNCQQAKMYGTVIEDYFHYGLIDGKAKVITSIAMFYDLEDPAAFCRDIYSTLEDDGLWVLQLSYLPLMLQQLAFDNICHEHLEYYTLASIDDLLSSTGFRIVDAQLNDTNGGSVRVYVQKEDANIDSFATAPYRDVADMRVESLMQYEYDFRYSEPWIYNNFFRNIEKLKDDTITLIEDLVKQGKTVWGYGASTKGNTLLQYFGLDEHLISGIAERSAPKFGLRTVGTNIPIYSEDDMRQVNPDYMLVLPWHFISSFVERESKYLNEGGHFIVPCPELKVI